jgi:hypothetical protein
MLGAARTIYLHNGLSFLAGATLNTSVAIRMSVRSHLAFKLAKKVLTQTSQHVSHHLEHRHSFKSTVREPRMYCPDNE